MVAIRPLDVLQMQQRGGIRPSSATVNLILILSIPLTPWLMSTGTEYRMKVAHMPASCRAFYVALTVVTASAAYSIDL